MKYLLLLSLVMIIFSCDNGPVRAELVIDSPKEMLKQEIAFKKKLEERKRKERDKTKNAIMKQAKRRAFDLDVQKLKQTDDVKIDFYLSEAMKADKVMDMPKAKRYAIKVLNIDPKNAEARKIYNKSNRFVNLFNISGVKDARIKREKRERMALMKIGKKAKGNDLYKSTMERQVKSFLSKQKYDVKFTEGKNGKPAKIRVLRK